MTDHVPRPDAHATTRRQRVAELHRLANKDYAQGQQQRARAALREPTDLEVAVSVAQQLLDSDSAHSVREALRLLLRAVGAETTTTLAAVAPPALRCPAAIPSDSTACDGPVVVLVLGLGDGGVAGCEHHAVRLMAAAPGTYPVALPHAPASTATRVFRAVGEAGRR